MAEERATILVVGDDARASGLQRRALEQEGYAVEVVDPAEMLRRLRRGPVDLVVLDCQLPGGRSGLDLLAELRAAGFDSPVVLVTGHGSENVLLRALRAGVRDVVPKSADFLEHLPAAVGNALRQARTERRLAQSESPLDEANDAIVVRDPDGRVVFWNRGAERVYGWTAAEAVAGAVAPTLDAASFLSFAEAHRAVARAGEWSGELRHFRRDGRVVTVASRWAVHRGPDGRPRGTLVIDTDVTARKQLEAQYLHAQRLESIGTLAGGVAHDFNNLLTVIVGCGEVLLAEASLTGKAREMAVGVVRAGEQGAALTRQLLAFGRRQAVAPRVLDVNRLVRETERMFARLIGEHIALRTDLAADAGRVRADPGQVEQVLMNLVVNARDAMPGGGTLTVETRNATLDAEFARTRVGVRPGPHVVMRVTDTGHGMDAATRERVFEPFFTTKEVGKGTGLGLAAAHGIVTQAGGHIEVWSEPGRGASFTVYLPRVDAPETDSGVMSVQAPRGTETVLIAEDEPRVRELARSALAASGYTVVEAADGAEAVRAAGEHPGPIHLLLTDVVMPGLGGGDLADRLARDRPGLRVLFMSGYPDDPALRLRVGRDGAGVLAKPFTRVSLGQAVRKVLDAVGARPAWLSPVESL